MEQPISSPPNNDEISLRDLIAKAKMAIHYLLSRWLLILGISLLGGAIGVLYAWLKPVRYVSRISFVVEESKSAGGSLAALAGQFGFDLGNAAGGGVFGGDNILLFLKSENLIRETLFTPDSKDSALNLADRYAAAQKLKDKWQKNKKIGSFQFRDYHFSSMPRVQDSLLQVLIKKIIKENLEVVKPDKKATFIEVTFNSRDELLSHEFTKQLVQIATEKYVESKTKLKAQNVAMLQRKADSLVAILNSRTYTAAATQQQLVDANPGLRTPAVAAEITSRDKTIAATLYAEVVKNLEISRTLLNQATPTIEIVDVSAIPLKTIKTKKVLGFIIGIALGGLLCVIYILFVRWWRSLV